jgi:hypothetical protein
MCGIDNCSPAAHVAIPPPPTTRGWENLANFVEAEDFVSTDGVRQGRSGVSGG